jgi:hypothetical protein
VLWITRPSVVVNVRFSPRIVTLPLRRELKEQPQQWNLLTIQTANHAPKTNAATSKGSGISLERLRVN